MFKKTKTNDGVYRGIILGLPISFFAWLVIGLIVWYFRTH